MAVVGCVGTDGNIDLNELNNNLPDGFTVVTGETGVYESTSTGKKYQINSTTGSVTEYTGTDSGNSGNGGNSENQEANETRYNMALKNLNNISDWDTVFPDRNTAYGYLAIIIPSGETVEHALDNDLYYQFVLAFEGNDKHLESAAFQIMSEDRSYALKSNGDWVYTDKSTNPETEITLNTLSYSNVLICPAENINETLVEAGYSDTMQAIPDSVIDDIFTLTAATNS